MRSIVIGAVFTGILGIGLALAQSDPIKERQELMKSNGRSVGTVTAMLKGEKPFDAKAAADAMGEINGNIGTFVTLFPEGTETGGNTRAKPEIWKNKKDFEDWGAQLKEDTAKAQAAAAGGMDSVRAALAEVGKTCTGCHDDYRAPEKK